MDHIEDQIAEELGRQIQQEIDNEILISLLVDMGWSKITLSNFNPQDVYPVEINHWLKNNVKNHWRRGGRTFVFEDGKDATMFALRWS